MKRILLLAVALLSTTLHAQVWNALSVDCVVSMNTSTVGTTVTAAIGDAGTVCGGNGTVGSNVTFTGGPGAPSNFTVGAWVPNMQNPAGTSTSSNLGPVQLLNGGALYAPHFLDFNNMGHADSANNTNAYWNFSGTPGSHTKISAEFQITLGPPYQTASGSDWDIFGIWDTSGNYYEAQLNNKCQSAGSNYGIRIEDKPTAHSICIPLAPQQTYHGALSADVVTGFSTLTMYTAGGTFIGTVSHIAGGCNPTACTGTTFRYIQFGNNESGNNTGTTTYYQNIMVNFSAPGFLGGSAATVTNGSGSVSGLTGIHSVCGGLACANYSILLPTTSVGNVAQASAVSFTIVSCSTSVDTCNIQQNTGGTLSSTYSGSTVSGTAVWELAPPLFYKNSALQVGVLAPARSINWQNAGSSLEANARTQCVNSQCATLTAAGVAATSAQINAALANAPANTYVPLVAGTYTNATSAITFGGNSNVTLRGAGADQTHLALTTTSGNASIHMGTGTNSAGSPQNGPVAVTGDTTQGSPTIILASVPNLKVGNPIIIDQLDANCDNGGVLISGANSSYTCTPTSPGLSGPYNTTGGGNAIRGGSGCSSPSNPNTTCFHQQQIAIVASCNGVTTVGSSCTGTNVTVGISPGLYMPNWNTSQTMSAWWATSPVTGNGVEDLDSDSTGNSGALGIEVDNCNGCWVKGVRSQDTAEAHVQLQYSTHTTVNNNYFFLTQGLSTISYGVECFSCADTKVENNIFQAVTTPMITNGPGEGNAYLYNYTINGIFTTSPNFSIPARGLHAADTSYELTEGNVSDGHTSDVIHGTGNMESFFRNAFYTQPACWTSGGSFGSIVYGNCNSGITTMQIYAFHRFHSLIGNVLGTSGVQTTYCDGNNAVTGCASGTTANNTNVLGIGYGNGGVPNDGNVVPSTMLWGNADPVTGFASPRFNCALNGVSGSTSEVPSYYVTNTTNSSIVPVRFQFGNPCPVINTLPASFYYASTPPWWPAGKPWPLIGPDVTGGNLQTVSGGTYARATIPNSISCPSGGTCSTYASGLANSNPAEDCYYVTMSGDPYGSGGPYSFNENTCYSASLSSPTQFNGKLTISGNIQIQP